MKARFYTGVGSRQTPKDIIWLMRDIASSLEAKHYTLRSGGAVGADQGFESGVKNPDMKQIFLPWPGFGSGNSQYVRPSEKAVAMGVQMHPHLSRLHSNSPHWETRKIKTLSALMGRNVHQVLGPELDSPSAFLICWTPDGVDGIERVTTQTTGGTGQAIRIAVKHGVPVFNLKREDHLARINLMLGATA